MADGEPAARLLSCLRENVAELNVGVTEPDRGHVDVNAPNVVGLPDLLEERLDQCAETLGISAWREHLLVDRA